MKRGFALWLLFVAWVAATPVAAEPLDGIVSVVIDGDTVLFKPDHYSPASRAFLKIRLADIDAPEHGQPHGEAASRGLKALVLNRRAAIEIVATDLYGRKVARLTVGSLAVNAEMVRRGLAWASTRGKQGDGLRAMQREARRERRGLWQDAAPTPPWVWRRAQSAAAS